MSRHFDPSTVLFPTHPTTNVTPLALPFLASLLLPYPHSLLPRMDSDDSTHTIFNTISQFKNSDIDTPDEFQNSEPSPSVFFSNSLPSNPSSTPRWNLPSPLFLHRRNTKTFLNDQWPARPPNPVTHALENELDSFITLQQQLQNTNKLILHQLSLSISSSDSSDQTTAVVETRAHRLFKKKHPNAQPHVLHRPQQVQQFSLHPLHTNTKEFLKYNLPFIPQYTYYQTTNNDQRNYVDELLTSSDTIRTNFKWNIEESNPL